MSDNKNVNDSPIPRFVDTTLENLLDKPSKNVGETLANIWFLVFGGISHKADKRKIQYSIELRKFENELQKKILEIPCEKRTEVDLQLVGNTLEASKYCIEKTVLRNMFTELIASSVNRDKCNYVQPAFPDLIKQLSSDEGNLLKYLFLKFDEENNRYPLIDIRIVDDYQVDIDVRGNNVLKEVVDGTVRTVRTFQQNSELIFGKTVFMNFYATERIFNVEHMDKISSYLTNLERMRIIDIRDRQIVCLDDELYSKIIESSLMETMLSQCDYNIPRNRNYYCFNKKYFCFTSFGIEFLKACL